MTHFVYTWFTKTKSIYIQEFLKIPGIILSIPEKEFLPSILSADSVYLLRLTKF